MSGIELASLWADVVPVPVPTPQQFQLWLRMHSPRVVREALLETAKKVISTPGEWELDRAVRFASGVMNARERTTNIHRKN